mgnify:CR=1 FL=1
MRIREKNLPALASKMKLSSSFDFVSFVYTAAWLCKLEKDVLLVNLKRWKNGDKHMPSSIYANFITSLSRIVHSFGFG